MRAQYSKHILEFINPAGTSRGVLRTKESYFIRVVDDSGLVIAIGECGILRGLSYDDKPEYERILEKSVSKFNNGDSIDLVKLDLIEYPSLRFAWEQVEKGLSNQNLYMHFENDFYSGKKGIEINGLIWMGDYQSMSQQIEAKIEMGFSCLKLKIGAIQFEEEIDLIRKIRNRFSKDDLEIRLDANGAFASENALDFLQQLSQSDIHSVEQPIKPGNWSSMSSICANSSIPIALDEELIGIHSPEVRSEMVNTIRPQYLIFKPSFLGGFEATNEWIELCDSLKIDYWITSALESNIGLNAIAQYAYEKNISIPQGLGTGSLYSNNITSPLEIRGSSIWYNPDLKWDVSMLTWSDV